MVSMLSKAFSPLQQALVLRSYREELLASNIANVDTPNYRAVGLDFRAALAAELNGQTRDLTLKRDRSEQFSGLVASTVGGYVKYRVGQQMGIDGNDVDLSREEARFTANALAYESDLAFLTGRINMLKLAIKG